MFHCEECGNCWAGDSICPVCMGFGKADSECTCKCFISAYGVKLNSIVEKNPTCPIHGCKK